LNATPRPARERIVSAMNGNVCRCGTYARIVEAIEAVSAASSSRESRQ
jgi:isoquinoline 1-oxidoreductase alpha subunit